MRIFLLCLLFAVQASAQEFSVRKGVVTDSIRVNDSLNQTYALYLPTDFENTAEVSVLFIFDGEGRGKSAAHLFQPAAEKQGYVLVSSNNVSPSKTLEENVENAIQLMNDVRRIFPFDPASVSIAGFAQGAKVATALPLILNQVHGVIFVSDYHFNLDFLEDKPPFYAVGIIGNQQMGALGMTVVSEDLKRMGFPGDVYTFDGGKEWPSPQIMSSAVGSLTLHAMRLGKRPVNDQLVDQLYQEDIGRANKLISNGKYLMAETFLEGLQEKYKELKEDDEIEDRLRQLRRMPNYKAQEEKMEEVVRKENRLWDDFVFYFNEDLATENFGNLGWWNYQKLQLEKLTESENHLESAMGHRLLNLMKELITAELASYEEKEVSLNRRLLANMLATVFDQQNFEAYKKIISLSAIDNDFPTALFYLEEMLKNGYSDMESLYEIEGTLGLQLSPKFNWLVKKYLGRSKYFNNAPNPFN